MDEVSSEEQREAMAKAVGIALDQWSQVELALEFLFAAALGIPEGPAHVVLSSVRSFNARLLVVNNLVITQGVGAELRARWTTLYNRLSKKNDKRNELAHFTILAGIKNGRMEARLNPYYSVGSLIVQDSRNPGRRSKMQGLSQKEVEERARSFASLAIDVLYLSYEIQQLLEQRAEAPEQARSPARKPDIPSDLNPRGQPGPPQSSEA